MSTPIELLKAFSSRLSEARVEYAITSGMARVFYGLQQTTKDSDIVIEVESLLPREEREKELTWIHQSFNTPDDLAVWPPELNEGSGNNDMRSPLLGA